MCKKQHVRDKKNIPKTANNGFATMCHKDSQRSIHTVAQRSLKKVFLAVFQDMKRRITIDFFENGISWTVFLISNFFIAKFNLLIE